VQLRSNLRILSLMTAALRHLTNHVCRLAMSRSSLLAYTWVNKNIRISAKSAAFLIGAFAILFQFLISNNVFAKDVIVQASKINSDKSAYFLRVNFGAIDVRVLTPSVPLGGSLSTAIDPERAPQGFLLADYLARYHAIAAVSGGYIDSYSPPTALGFVKSNGIVAARSHNSWLTNGVFCSDVGRAVIKMVETSVDVNGFRDCLQAGPLLLANGVPMRQDVAGYQRLAQSVQEQTFVCIDNDKQVVLGVTDKVDFGTLVSFLYQISCVDSLRLTGLDTAGLRIRNQLFGRDEYLFPSAIGVIQK
jgi:hypothetical protein